MQATVDKPVRAAARPLMRAVTELTPVAIASADAAERERSLTADTVAALIRSGILAMKVPAVLGGAEADLLTQIDIIEALGYADASLAWCAMIGATAIAWPAAFLRQEAIDVLFADGIPPAAVVVQPGGTASYVSGGYRLTGRWTFASGIGYARWVTACAVVEEPGGSTRRMMVVPIADVSIEDNWHVSGLCATGSHAFSMTDVFVQEAFTWAFPAARPRRGGPMYRLGWPGFVAHEPPALALGIARRALVEVIELAESESQQPRPLPLRQRDHFQHELARAWLSLRSARTLTEDVFGSVWSEATAGTPPGPRVQAEMRATAAHVTQVAIELVSFAYRVGGSAAVYRSNRLQRCLCDLNTAGQHWLARETALANYGQFLLGLTNPDPTGDAR